TYTLHKPWPRTLAACRSVPAASLGLRVGAGVAAHRPQVARPISAASPPAATSQIQ
ncbi:hypothetical protein T492DRAFT_941810, partial [Pavlovales sp. CCMP2436]